jgi:preprotein translocase subunit SecE
MNFRLSLTVLILIAGFASFYMLAEQPVVFRVLSVLIGLGAATAVFWTTPKGKEIFGFLIEAKRVVWPTRKETIQMTLVVFIFVVLAAIFLAFVDIGFSYIINLILGRGN